jgi:DNA-binding transcriptional regulator GbsR (MarR family)
MSQTQSASDNFIEQMGHIMQAEGAPRIAGRIIGLLLVENRQFSLSEMSERLKISKASASTNARLLAESGIIRAAGKIGDRQTYYEIGENPYPRIQETLVARMRRLGNLIHEASARFDDAQQDARDRTSTLADFYLQLATLMAGWQKDLETARSHPITTTPNTANPDDH